MPKAKRPIGETFDDGSSVEDAIKRAVRDAIKKRQPLRKTTTKARSKRRAA